MSPSFRLEGLAAFLAGAGLGAALARPLPETIRRLGGGGGNLQGTGGAAPVAASLGRMQALLGEIRGLLGPQGAPPAAPVPPEGNAGETPDAPEAGVPRGADRPSGTDAWRTPDRIGYWVGGGKPDSAGLLALCAALVGAAAAWAAVRKGGAAAAWPALAGFLAAGAWAGLAGRNRAAASGRRGAPAPLSGPSGPRGSRSGRPAMP